MRQGVEELTIGGPECGARWVVALGERRQRRAVELADADEHLERVG